MLGTLIIIFIMGLCYNIAFVFSFEKIYPEECEIDATLQIISIKEEKDYTNKYIGKVIACNIPSSENTKIIIYVDKKYDLIPGDIIKTNGKFEKADTARNYGGFNYRNYLKTSKIYGILNVEKLEKYNNKNNFVVIIEKIRLRLLNKIDELYEKEDAEFLKGILIGKTDGIDEETKNNFKDSSISHILAISGLHVSYVILGINLIINKIIKDKKKQNIIMIVFVLLYMFLTGFTASCIRSCIMISMTLISSIFYRKNNVYISIILSFFILIMINPFNIYNIGMWLSFAGTIGIIIFSKTFYRIFQIRLRKNKIYLYVLNIILISISAQILILPIMIYCFNIISGSFFIPNFFISFLISPILALGYISVLLSYLKIPIINILVYIEKILIFLVIEIADICSKIPFSKIYVSTPTILFVILYYIGIVFVIYFFNTKKIYFFRLIISFKFLKLEIKRLFSNFNFISIISISIILVIFINIPSQNLNIYFIDVGQGDCTVIQTPNGNNIIIDGGEGNTEKYDYGKNVVLPYLLDRKIKRIDYMIISHCDSDHIGGLFEVLKELKVEKILIGIQPEISEQFEELVKVANNKKIEIFFLQSGDKIKIENNLEIEVLWPNKENLIQENALNNNSLVFKLIYNKLSILFTGDIEKIAEETILDLYSNNLTILKSDILKVAHHGSKTSSIIEFLEIINPKIALIGVGKDNKFGHPNKEILERLNDSEIEIYRTDIDGEINISIDGKIRQIFIDR